MTGGPGTTPGPTKKKSKRKSKKRKSRKNMMNKEKKPNYIPLDNWIQEEPKPVYTSSGGTGEPKDTYTSKPLQNSGLSQIDPGLQGPLSTIIGGLLDTAAYISDKFRQYDSKIEKLESKYVELDARQRKLEQRVGGLEERLNEFEKETNKKFEKTDRKFGVIKEIIDEYTKALRDTPANYIIVKKVKPGTPGARVTPDGEYIIIRETTGPLGWYKPVAERLEKVRELSKQI